MRELLGERVPLPGVGDVEAADCRGSVSAVLVEGDQLVRPRVRAAVTAAPMPPAAPVTTMVLSVGRELSHAAPGARGGGPVRQRGRAGAVPAGSAREQPGARWCW